MTSPNFRTLLKSAGNDEIVVPLLRNSLWKPDFNAFNIKVEGFSERQPDGWFHPSVHPRWTEPMLYHYLVNYERMTREPFDPQSTIAVTVGSFMHTFVQSVLVKAGVLVKQAEVCECGQKHPERAEVYLVDDEAKSRGHSDGVVKIDGSGFEFKTMNPNKMGRIPKGAGPKSKEMMDWFQKACPDYYLQAQEYLRMGEREQMVVVIMALTYPFEMREIHVPYHPPTALGVRDKYIRVLQSVADQRPPHCECGPLEKTCPAWVLCYEDFL